MSTQVKQPFHYRIVLVNGNELQGIASDVKVRQAKYSTRIEWFKIVNPSVRFFVSTDDVMSIEWWVCGDDH